MQLLVLPRDTIDEEEYIQVGQSRYGCSSDRESGIWVLDLETLHCDFLYLLFENRTRGIACRIFHNDRIWLVVSQLAHIA